MIKKISIIIAIILIAVTAVVGLFLIFNNSSSEENGGGEPSSGNFFGNLFPFGGNDNERREIVDGDTTTGGNTNTGNNITGSGGFLLRQLTTEPIAAAGIPQQNGTTTSASSLVRYVERATGHVFEVDIQTVQKKRLSNTTIAGIREGVWHQNGKEVIIRYLNSNDVIETFSAHVPTTTISIIGTGKESPLEGVFLENDIPFIVSLGDKIFYFTFQNRSLNGYTAAFDGGNREIIFSTPFTEWIPQWPRGDTLSLTTKASGFFPGFLYFVDIASGEFTNVLSDIPGLTTNTNPEKNIVLYSQSTGTDIELYSYSVEDNISQKLSLVTLPEKCVWSRERVGVAYCGVPTEIQPEVYPDAWYQGLESFSDGIWEVDVLRNISEIIISPSVFIGGSEGIDIINPMVSQNDEFLIFTNKNDSTLWRLNLK